MNLQGLSGSASLMGHTCLGNLVNFQKVSQKGHIVNKV